MHSFIENLKLTNYMGSHWPSRFAYWENVACLGHLLQVLCAMLVELDHDATCLPLVNGQYCAIFCRDYLQARQQHCSSSGMKDNAQACSIHACQ